MMKINCYAYRRILYDKVEDEKLDKIYLEFANGSFICELCYSGWKKKTGILVEPGKRKNIEINIKEK